MIELQDGFDKEDTTKFDNKVAAITNRTHTRRENMQGMFQYRVFNIHLEGRAIPTFTGEKCEGSSICFTVPSSSLPTHRRRIQSLNAWCKFEITDFNLPAAIRRSIKIKNNIKDLTWIHSSNYVLFHIYVGWLSRWRSFGSELKAGDEIIITFDCSNHC
ncbi:hypothetical protein LguiA_008179 [Lonicera macranthoides]